MQPRDLLRKYLFEDVVPLMKTLGFSYSDSQLHFSRKKQDIRQIIRFSLSKWNIKDHCTFWTMWGVNSVLYSQWYKSEWGEDVVNNALGGAGDWNIPGWRRGADHYFHLNNTKSDKYEIQRLISNIQEAGLPFFDSISTWEGAAAHLVKEKFLYHRAVDFLVIDGNLHHAKEILIEGIHQYEKLGRIDNFEDLPKLKARLTRYFEQNKD